MMCSGLLIVWANSFEPVGIVLSINGLHNPYLDFAVSTLTNLGDGLLVVPFVLWLLFFRVGWAVGLVGSALLQALIVSLFKRLLFHDSLRPITYLVGSVAHHVPGVSVHQWMSFPSGHTVTIFALCIYVALCFRHRMLSIGLCGLAMVVGLSRVYLLQHFMHDVGAGALIGSAIGLFAFSVVELVELPAWMNMRLHITLLHSRTHAHPAMRKSLIRRDANDLVELKSE